MKKNLIIIFIGLGFLTIALIVGTPFEFLNSAIDTLATLLLMLLIFTLFVYLFIITQQIEKKLIRKIALGFICITAIPYSLIGIWTMMIVGNNHPIWQDMSIYTNKNGERVISQWRETSGSIYDYRDRKIISDFGQFRISFDCDRKKLKGVWTEYNINTREKKPVEFEKEGN